MLIFFDFDDTLTSCTWVSRVVAHLAQQKEFTVIKDLIRWQTELVDLKATKLLKLVIKKGITKIVSNAEMAWINYVLDNFSPALKALIKAENIEIISARDLYSKAHPDDCIKWKENCFRDEISKHLRTQRNPKDMVVSIGDGQFERIACKIIAYELNIPYCSLKLLEMPSPNLLSHQLDIIASCFDELVSLTPACINGIKRGASSLQDMCNDLFLEFNASRTGMCIYHWNAQMAHDDDLMDTETPGTSQGMSGETSIRSISGNNKMGGIGTNKGEEECNMMRTACLDVTSQAASCESVA